MSAVHPGLTVTRISAADASVVLERLAGSDRLERGAVFVISVEAIRERSGDRWSKKRDDVWGYLGRKLNEYLSYQDVHQRLNETDVLVAMTTEDGVAAQAVGMKVLEDVLEFFLGAAERKDIRIRGVSRIDGEDLLCADLDPEIIATAREKEAAAPYHRQVSAELERAHNPVSFVAHNGQRLEVAFALEHVVSLRHGVTAVLRVEPTVTFRATGEVIPARRFHRLADSDMIAIDRATMAFGGLFIPEDARTKPPVILPASFRTLGGRKGRNSLIAIDGVSPDLIRQGAMIEFIDVDRGTPAGRLVEVVSLVGGVTRGVLARLQPIGNAIEAVQGARFNGLTVDFADLGLPDGRLPPFMRAMAHQMRGKAPALIAQGLGERLHLEMADDAGFTHAGIRAAPNTVTRRNVA
ncbi:hypothetical protein [uncultured Phenylobacterium sp.]|uniref:hypothetical protein n=1 Tax=uncultured Phenylobacterium sp. TaxID=349273 RepID=UPI0025EE051F|nr:hypothetical protein [uncultured Phenylobacterium sp.]